MMRFAHGYSVLAALIVFGSIDHVAHAQTPTIAPGLKDQYRRPPARPVENKALVELGRELFSDKQLSASGKTACLSCHLPNAAWSVLEGRSTTAAGKLTGRTLQTPHGSGNGSTAT